MDPECQGDPIEKIYTIWVETSLEDEPRGVYNGKLHFDLIIGNGCKEDVINISDIDSFTYKLRTPAAVTSFLTEVTQTKDGCPYTCLLTHDDGKPITDDLGILIKGQTMEPELRIETADKSLDGRTIGLRMTCVSTLSESEEKVA